MESEPESASRAWGPVALIGTQALVILLFYVASGFHGMSSAGCSPNCDLRLFTGANETFLWSSLAVLLLTIAATVALNRNPRRRTLPPVIGLTLTIVGAVVAYVVAGLALQPQ